MGMYNTIFGVDAFASPLLGSLGLAPGDFYRFRDCYLSENGLIAVYTRGGGNNRECSCGFEEGDHIEGCVVAVQALNRLHPKYHHDEDDSFDNTYATFYYNLPDILTPEITARIPRRKTRDEAWADALATLKAKP